MAKGEHIAAGACAGILAAIAVLFGYEMLVEGDGDRDGRREGRDGREFESGWDDMTDDEWADMMRMERLREGLDEIESLVDFAALNEATPFTIQQGETGMLKERSNPTTGFMWLIDDSDCLDLGLMVSNVYVMDEFDDDEFGEMPMGMGGTDVFMFESKETGSCDVKFAYAQPWDFSWDEPSNAMELVEITIEVGSD